MGFGNRTKIICQKCTNRILLTEFRASVSGKFCGTRKNRSFLRLAAKIGPRKGSGPVGPGLAPSRRIGFVRGFHFGRKAGLLQFFFCFLRFCG
jgi:hypothetical protein